MAVTEVLLLKYIRTLGSEGDQVKVKSGYARNFLFPRGMALPLTQANRKQIDALKKRREIREKHDIEEAQKLADLLSRTPIAIVVKTGDNGKMFGAVSAKEICDHLLKSGIEIDKKKVHLKNHIKEVGRHKVVVNLHESVSVELDIDIVSENPIKK
jgi:large subunit ribosomal protein L9